MAIHQQAFCPRCGEKRYDPRALSIRHFFEETLEGLFHFDSKFLRTVRTLLLRPGRLSVDHVEGRRVGAVKPFQLFLIVNLLVFVLLFTNPFSIPLQNYITYKPFIHYHTVELVQARIAATKLAPEAFAHEFDHAMHGASKSLLVLLVPLYALLFGLLFLNKRRRAVEHLVFATHYITFTLLTFLLCLYLTLPLEAIAEPAGGGHGFNEYYDLFFTVLFSALFAVWLFFAIKRFYRPHPVQGVLASLLVGAAFFQVLQAYRMLLFFGVLRTIH